MKAGGTGWDPGDTGLGDVVHGQGRTSHCLGWPEVSVTGAVPVPGLVHQRGADAPVQPSGTASWGPAAPVSPLPRAPMAPCHGSVQHCAEAACAMCQGWAAWGQTRRWGGIPKWEQGPLGHEWASDGQRAREKDRCD